MPLSRIVWHSKTPHLLDSISYCLTNGVQFRLAGCSFYFCLFLRYRKISVFTNHAVAIAVIPKIAFIDQLYAKVAVFGCNGRSCRPS